MKCKKIFALLLSLCMIASTFVALPASVSAATTNVIDIDAPLDDASELTFVGSSVTVSNADGVGGRDDVVKAEGVKDSLNNTVGIWLPDGFAFEANDVVTYSVDVYSESVINPDMWLRNHLNGYDPCAVLYEESRVAGAWTTVTQTLTYDELTAKITASGSFTEAHNYAFYMRPRTTEATATVYLDNLKFKVTREVVARENVIDITVNDASDITWKNGGTATDANGIGGRDGVIALGNLANVNTNTAGVKLPDGFAFQAGDILTYSFDVYSDTVTNPDIWLRNHGASLDPFTTFYHTSTLNTWTTITKTVSYEEISAFGVSGNYALYVRPRQSGTVYVDNFQVTVSRVAKETFVAASAEATDATGLTMVGANVTLTGDQTIGGKSGVIKAEGVGNSNDGIVGVKLPDGFAFRADDKLTYSVDVYSETEGYKPDIYVRDHSDFNPMAVFYGQATAANAWTTIEKTVTYAELVAADSTGKLFTDAGNYAVYLRPRDTSALYLDNFTVTVTRTVTGEPTLVKTVDYVTFEDGVFKATTADIATTEQSGAWSSQVRLRIIPEQPVSTSEALKVSFDFKAAGILNSEGNLYETMPVSLRLYDSVDGTGQANTIGYIRANVPANAGTAVTAEFYIEDMENGGGASTLTEIKSIGVQVDMNGACIQYGKEANDGYYTISNVKIESEEKPEHVHSYSDWTKVDDDNHKKVCACGDIVTEAHTWSAPKVTEPSIGVDGSEVYTCITCKAKKTIVLKYRKNAVDVTATDAAGLTMVGDTVTLTGDQTVGGKSGVVKASGVSSANGGQVGVKLPDGFAFKTDDILTYSVDVYSESAVKPDIYVRDHKDFNPMAIFYYDAITAGEWTTITKTVTYDELVAASLAANSNDTFNEAGNFAVYIRPREATEIYVDNFTVTVSRVVTGEPTLEKTVDYVTLEDGVFTATTADIATTEASGAWSSKARLRILPEVPVSVNEPLKISFDFESVGILNSHGQPYQTMVVNLRLYDSVDGETQANTIGYIKNEAAVANFGAPVTLEYYIEDMVNGGGASTLTDVKSIGVQVDMYGACTQYTTEANDGYFTISNVNIESVEKPEHEHAYGDWIKVDDETHKKACGCGDIVTEAHTWDDGVVESDVITYTCAACGATKTEAYEARIDVVDIDSATTDYTMVGANVTLTPDQTIGDRSGVVKAENVSDSNAGIVGFKLPDGFAFKADDILTYSVDVYSESAVKPDIYVRNHGTSYNPMAPFYNTAITAGAWTTITKTVTFAELEAAIAENSSGTFATADNYAVYLRPRDASVVYLDNFTVTVSRVLTGEPTVTPTVNHVTEENGVYKVTTADVVANETEGAVSSQVRLRILPETPVSTTEALKITLDFEANGILNSQGDLYDVMSVNLRLYDSVDGTTQANTIGYIKNANALANTGAPVTLEFYIEDMVNGGGTATLTDIKSIGVQVDMYGAFLQYNVEANDGYFTVSNVNIEKVSKDDHEHAFIGYKKITETEGCHAKICACGYQEEELHAWDEGVITKDPTTTEEGEKRFTCTVCEATKTESIDMLPDVPTYVSGDANGDGGVDTKDVIMIRRSIAGGYGVTIDEQAADVTGDGKADTKDVIMIRRFITGGYGVEL